MPTDDEELLGAIADLMDGKVPMDEDDDEPDLPSSDSPTIVSDTTATQLINPEPDDTDDGDDGEIPLAGQDDDGVGDEAPPPPASSSVNTEGDPSAPSAPPADESPRASLDRLLEARLGRPPTDEETRLAYHALSGAFDPAAPAQPAAPAPSASTDTFSSTTPAPQVDLSLPEVPEHLRDDPEVQAYLAQVAGRLSTAEQTLTAQQAAAQRAQAQRAQAEWDARITAASDAAMAQLRREYPDLPPEHYLRIEQRAIESRRLPIHVQAYGDDIQGAIMRTYRDAIGDLPDVATDIFAKAQARQSIEDQEAAKRKAKAGQVSSGASKTPPQRRSRGSVQDDDAQLLAEISEIMRS